MDRLIDPLEKHRRVFLLLEVFPGGFDDLLRLAVTVEKLHELVVTECALRRDEEPRIELFVRLEPVVDARADLLIDERLIRQLRLDLLRERLDHGANSTPIARRRSSRDTSRIPRSRYS